MQGCLVTTTHNHLTYDAMAVEGGMTLDTVMPDMHSRLGINPTEDDKAKPPEDAKGGIGKEDEPRQTFREYYKYASHWQPFYKQGSHQKTCNDKNNHSRDAMFGTDRSFYEGNPAAVQNFHQFDLI